MRAIKNFLAPLRWIRAKCFGYFWLDCPMCSEKFAGFEVGGSLSISEYEEEGVCRWCKGVQDD